ncbi:hypothetical protein X753_14030 [Mesorhizobium sp. LNJC399B00]|nr:hypothetical protein X753_14030 [Mesorhizobium sp. LNJC399B00]
MTSVCWNLESLFSAGRSGHRAIELPRADVSTQPGAFKSGSFAPPPVEIGRRKQCPYREFELVFRVPGPPPEMA